MLLLLLLSEERFFVDLRAEGYKQLGFSPLVSFLSTEVGDLLAPVEGYKQPSSAVEKY